MLILKLRHDLEASTYAFDLRAFWVYIYTSKLNVETSRGIYIDLQSFKPTKKRQKKPSLTRADSQIKAWLGSFNLSYGP